MWELNQMTLSLVRGGQEFFQVPFYVRLPAKILNIKLIFNLQKQKKNKKNNEMLPFSVNGVSQGNL